MRSAPAQSRQSNRAPRITEILAGRPRSARTRALVVGVIALAQAIGLAACEKKGPLVSDGGVYSTVTYRGVFVQAGAPLITSYGLKGAITLRIREPWFSDPAPIDSAEVDLVGDEGRAQYAGRFDPTSGRLTVSGVPWLSCTREESRFLRLEGSHGFLVVPPQSPQDIRAYGGTWSGSGDSPEDSGRLAILIDGTRVIGVGADIASGSLDLVEGTYGPLGAIRITTPRYTLTGTTSGIAIFGDYETTSGERRTGTWSVTPFSF